MSHYGISRRQNLVPVLLGVVFMVAIALLAIGSYKLRLAGIHEDNGAVFYTYLYGHAAEFSRDPFAAADVHWLWGSVCLWVPVLAHQYFGLDPRIPDYVFYLLQDVLLGMSVFVLTYVVSRSWLTAFGSMALAIVLQPWGWNLASYSMGLDGPFYTALAEALATLAGAAFLARRWNIAWMLGAATALVHPVILCYLLAMLASWMWLNRVSGRGEMAAVA